MITVTTAPPFATVQDLGRFGFRDSGVPVSGVADRDAALALNVLLGNHPNAAMIEWAVAGGALKFEHAMVIAIGGAEASCAIGENIVDALTRIEVAAGDELIVHRIVHGRFLLIAVRGGIDVPPVLGSRSTLLSAVLGGLDGRRLRRGDQLPIGNAIIPEYCEKFVTDGRRVIVYGDAIRVMRGPQAALFDERTWFEFLNTTFTVSRASDRAGYRLDGATFRHNGAASLPSEPSCVGAIQVPDGGSPIVIMHDGPTVGGYPKIAVIGSSQISRFAQLAPGDVVRFDLA
jgi:biotin-dependent carboxylase-like uncharacterized protein